MGYLFGNELGIPRNETGKSTAKEKKFNENGAS